jgi:hypothetical protein
MDLDWIDNPKNRINNILRTSRPQVLIWVRGEGLEFGGN